MLIRVDDILSRNSNSALSFEVTVKCTKSIDLVTDPIADISRLVEVDPPTTYQYAMPTYAINPSFCLQTDFVFHIEYYAVPVGTTFPTFLTYDSTQVIINTSDSLGVKVYNFRVDVTEPLSGLVNN